jgi:hypothetical protein
MVMLLTIAAGGTVCGVARQAIPGTTVIADKSAMNFPERKRRAVPVRIVKDID